MIQISTVGLTKLTFTKTKSKMLTSILTATGILGFLLFYKAINFFEKNANPSERFRKTLQRVGEEDFRSQLKDAYEGQ
mgnify:CR=1 FL=1